MRQENKYRLDWQKKKKKNWQKVRRRAEEEWLNEGEECRMPGNQLLCLWRHFRQLAFILPHIFGACSPLSSTHSPFLCLSVAKNLNAWMMSINMFKMAVRDLRCFAQSLYTLKCHILSVMCPREYGFEIDWESKTNSWVVNTYNSQRESRLPNMQLVFSVLSQWQDWFTVIAETLWRKTLEAGSFLGTTGSFSLSWHQT